MALHVWHLFLWWDDRLSLRSLKRRWSHDLCLIALQIEDMNRASFSSPASAEERATPSASTGVWSVIKDDKKFQSTLDVTLQAGTLEITTKDDRLIIHVKHEENK
ncbi:hypothetical protein TTRE_0000964801, partial [Trichuris trichiura]